MKNNIAFILGAGFSKCAELPIQNEFSKLLVNNINNLKIDNVITDIIKTFLKDIFNWDKNHDIPSLEDIFTFIDLSSGAGHHLGIKYTPKMLRAIRWKIIYE